MARKRGKNDFTYCYCLTALQAERKTMGAGVHLSGESCLSRLSSVNEALDSIPCAAENWARKYVPVIPALGRWKQAD